MELSELTITRAIMDRYFEKLRNYVEMDVAIVGGGPSGLIAAWRLAASGRKVAMFERKLSVGGGMWGGGMLMNEIVVQAGARRILDELGIRSVRYAENHYTADSVEAVSTMTSRAVQAGCAVFNCVSVEDVVMRPDRVTGLVLNWTPVEMTGLHVDPLAVGARCVIDATGHDIEVVKVVRDRVRGKLMTATGDIGGQRSMWAEEAERLTLENTREIYPGLFVSGMAANAAFGGPRMGPVFGGMLLSGEKVADLVMKRLEAEDGGVAA